MPTLHSVLSGIDNHEVLGVDTALAGQVLSADGAGHGVFSDPIDLVTVDFSSVAEGFSSISINPSTTDSSVVASFTDITSSSDVTLDPSGTITFDTAGTYLCTFNLNIGRSSNTGTAKVLAALRLNNVQIGYTQGANIATSASTHPAQFNLVRRFDVNDVLVVRVMRDSTGADDGGLIAIPVTVPTTWADVASYWVRITRIAGGA